MVVSSFRPQQQQRFLFALLFVVFMLFGGMEYMQENGSDNHEKGDTRCSEKIRHGLLLLLLPVHEYTTSTTTRVVVVVVFAGSILVVAATAVLWLQQIEIVVVVVGMLAMVRSSSTTAMILWVPIAVVLFLLLYIFSIGISTPRLMMYPLLLLLFP